MRLESSRREVEEFREDSGMHTVWFEQALLKLIVPIPVFTTSLNDQLSM